MTSLGFPACLCRIIFEYHDMFEAMDREIDNGIDELMVEASYFTNSGWCGKLGFNIEKLVEKVDNYFTLKVQKDVAELTQFLGFSFTISSCLNQSPTLLKRVSLICFQELLFGGASRSETSITEVSLFFLLRDFFTISLPKNIGPFPKEEQLGNQYISLYRNTPNGVQKCTLTLKEIQENNNTILRYSSTITNALGFMKEPFISLSSKKS